MVIFFAVAHLDRHPQRHSLRSHLRRAAPLYLLCLLLAATMISGWSRSGFGEFVEIYFIPFEIFSGGIVGDLLYYLTSPERVSRE
jgi:hypothetical protein